MKLFPRTRDLGSPPSASMKTHLAHIFTEFGVDDRTAAVTVALDLGVIRLKR